MEQDNTSEPSEDQQNSVTDGDRQPSPQDGGEPSGEDFGITRREILRKGWSVPVIVALSMPKTASADGHFSPGKTEHRGKGNGDDNDNRGRGRGGNGRGRWNGGDWWDVIGDFLDNFR